MNKETSKALGQFVGMVINFVMDVAIIKFGWDALLVKIFPTLPLITWGQAFALFFICGALFKTRYTNTKSMD